MNLTSSKESRTADDTSLSNHAEADFVVKLFEHYKQFHGSGMDIGVISPYKKQVRLVRNMLQSQFGTGLKRDVEVNTVDGFQGREKEMIVFSCVRSGDSIGFLSDVRRLNVAITRARSCLVLIGSEATLIRNDCWLEMIVYLKTRNFFQTTSSFQTLKERFQPGLVSVPPHTEAKPAIPRVSHGRLPDRGAVLKMMREEEERREKNGK